MVPHAHDTYLDQTLSRGVSGMLLYVGSLCGGAVIAWRRFRRRPSEQSLLPAILLTWLALTGVAESTPLDPYLPTILAYSCLVKVCLIEGSEEETDSHFGDEIIHGMPRPKSLVVSSSTRRDLSDPETFPPGRLRRRTTVL